MERLDSGGRIVRDQGVRRAYCGTVEIHAKEGFIIRHYEINQSPNAVGKVTKRWYTFQGKNRMSLRIDTPELAAPVVENTLIWERVGK